MNTEARIVALEATLDEQAREMTRLLSVLWRLLMVVEISPFERNALVVALGMDPDNRPPRP